MTTPVDLAELVAAVESSQSPYKIHYDPGYHPDLRAIDDIKKANGCDGPTAHIIAGCSWGLYQIEGDSLYLTCGWTFPIVSYLTSPGSQRVAFMRFITTRHIGYNLGDVVNDVVKRNDFAHHYNGDISAYSARLLKVYEDMRDGKPY